MVSIFNLLFSLKTYKFVWECITRTYGGTEETELHIFGSQCKAEVWKRNFRSLEVLAKMKCGSRLIHIWKSWQNKCWRWTRYFESWPSGVRKRNFRCLAVKAAQKCGSATSHLWKFRQRWNAEVDLPILGSPGRTNVEDERDLSDRAEVRKAELHSIRCTGCAQCQIFFQFTSIGATAFQPIYAISVKNIAAAAFFFSNIFSLASR